MPTALPIAQAHLDLVLLAVLGAVAVLLIVAYHSQVPYPILLVVGGAALGFIPGVPDVQLDPDVVLVIVLPPLLYAAAFFSSLRDLRDNLRLDQPAGDRARDRDDGRGRRRRPRGHRRHVVAGGVRARARSCRPTDPVAATAIAARVGAPRRYRDDRRGRGAGQRRDRAGRLQVRRRRGGHAAASRWPRRAGASCSTRSSASRSGSRSAASSPGCARRSTTRRPRSRSRWSRRTSPTCRPRRSGVSAVLAAVTAGIYLGWRSPELITPGDADPGLLGLGDPRLRPQRRAVRARRAAAAERHRRHQRAVDRRDRRLTRSPSPRP